MKKSICNCISCVKMKKVFVKINQNIVFKIYNILRCAKSSTTNSKLSFPFAKVSTP
jgi:hypothetical protein